MKFIKEFIRLIMNTIPRSPLSAANKKPKNYRHLSALSITMVLVNIF